MIPASEVDRASASFLSKTYHDITTKDNCFKAGVQFAEEYLKNLDIEFAQYYYANCENNSKGECEYWFGEFIKTKNSEK